ncbi:MAG TPA: hypothetical protein VH373_11335 [Jatrophihabitantaceae bacterium]|jgi:hypothetical protein
MTRRRALGCVLAVVVVAAAPATAQARPSGGPQWIIEGPGNQNALASIQQLDPDLAAAFFDNDGTTVLAGDARPSEPPRKEVPPGWSAIAAQHYTSFGPCPTNADGVPQRACASLSADIGALVASGVPTAMFDDENWDRTPDGEKADVCTAMQHFTDLAHANGIETIMAPDQNLASPGVITSYQGGESENWQTYLRLGLARCAAATGTEHYHIMSQPFETPWCGGQGSACEGNEAEFADFVTQAGLQARAVDPDAALTAGLSTNPRYNVTPQAMYQDTVNARRLVPGMWLNVAGNPTDPATAVQYLELLSGLVPLYVGGADLSPQFPTGSQPGTASLATTGSDLTFVSGANIPGGAVIPPGDYKFEPWTGGGTGSATVSVEVGYCTPPACTDRTPIIGPGAWTADLAADDPGMVSTHRTTVPTALPDGPHRLYLVVHVVAGAPCDLQYGTASKSTNLALPRPSSQPPARVDSPVVFAGRGGRLSPDIPAGAGPAELSLARAGNAATFVSTPSLRAGTVVPAGAWEFQYWTRASGKVADPSPATVDLEVGYCGGACRDRTPIIGAAAGWRSTPAAGAQGAADPGGAFTTVTPTQLPSSGGPFRMYWTVKVVSPGDVDLLYDSARTATNVATPLPMPASH